MSLEFPTNPADGDIYGNYQWDDTAGVWKLLPSPTQILTDLGDVDAATPNNGDIVVYNSASGDWENQAPEVSLGLVIALG